MPENLTPLPAAEQEALAVADLLNTQPFIGAAATKQSFLDRLANAQLIHIATHGLVGYGQSDSLDAPGALAFAAPDTIADRHSAAFLTAKEISKLQTQSNLVVLSACDTGRGTITGDGVVGLARSWMGAGASSVIVSLWAVNDQSTAYFMEQFYRSLQQQNDRAIALRQAALATMKLYPSPHDWAAFTLIGQAGNTANHRENTVS